MLLRLLSMNEISGVSEGTFSHNDDLTILYVYRRKLM